MSPNESEPDSASLHQVSVVKLPETMKPVTCGEEMSICSHRALRGDRGERAQKDVQRNLGDPLREFTESKIESWLGLKLNRTKTKIVNLQVHGESLDFLGFTFTLLLFVVKIYVSKKR